MMSKSEMVTSEGAGLREALERIAYGICGACGRTNDPVSECCLSDNDAAFGCDGRRCVWAEADARAVARAALTKPPAAQEPAAAGVERPLPTIIEAPCAMASDGYDWHLTCEWPDGTETIERVTDNGARALGLDVEALINGDDNDQHGHTVRPSDSSLYDLKCTRCGGTDASGDRRLDAPCVPVPPADPKTPDAGMGERCPIGLDDKPGICSAGTCKACAIERLAQPASVGEDETGVREAALEQWWNASGIERHDAKTAFRAAWALAPQPPKAETPAGVVDTLETAVAKLIDPEAFLWPFANAKGRDIAREKARALLGSHSTAPAARPGDGVETEAQSQEGAR